MLSSRSDIAPRYSVSKFESPDMEHTTSKRSPIAPQALEAAQKEALCFTQKFGVDVVHG